MEFSEQVKSTLAKLTLEEKISILAGIDYWQTVPIPEKGVPQLKTSDGPNGARGGTFKDGVTSACFPAACSVASTFDVDLAHRIGVALGEETLTKGARCLLAPTMCGHRHPLGGRNFESFSEDPFLAGKLAARNVVGVESTGVSATIKHFAANEQETQRLSVDEKVSERALREIYLKPFEFAIKEGKPGAVMTAYNQVNGCHADSHKFLLQQVLRGEWGWDGLVMSDWGGTNSITDSLNAGLDLEMPGPTRWRRIEDVVAAIKAGETTEEVIDQRALRVLWYLERQRCFEDPTIPDEQAINKPEHQALIREAGAKGIVLLKNDNSVLPLTKEKAKGKKIAMLGYAKECLAHGGGSAAVNSHYKITPWDALNNALGEEAQFSYAKGAHTFRQLPVIRDNIKGSDGTPGFTFRIYEPGNSQPERTIQGHETSEVSPLIGLDLVDKDIDLTTTFTAPETAKFYFAMSGLGPTQFIINDELVYEQKENCSDSMGFLLGGVNAPLVTYSMEAGKEYKIFITSKPPAPIEGEDLGILQGRVGIHLGHMSATEHDKDILTEAVEMAKASDVAIVFTGHDAPWETEGQDQVSFNLPKEGSQDRLVSEVAKVNPNTIVVNSTGVAIAMPWLDQVQGLLQAWFPGQEAGNCIADVITGAVNPEGRLTCTFPKRLEDCPAYGNFPGEYVNRKLKVSYEEGVFVGYRHFDRLPADKVNFPFGFGLSYTQFDYAKLAVKEVSAEEWTVSVDVTNTGSSKGGVAVQLYVGAAQTPADTPVKSLASFKKVTLGPGASGTIELPVKARDFASWDESTQQWVVRGGEYNFSVGKSAGELVLSSSVQVAGQTWKP